MEHDAHHAQVVAAKGGDFFVLKVSVFVVL
jgi:hypothetical protein